MADALDISELHAGYGRFDVLHGIALNVKSGEAIGLLGPNGAGKTTLLQAIMGMTKQRRGTIKVDGVDVSTMPPHRIARGLAALTPEGRRLFTDQTVEDNLLIGGLHHRHDKAKLNQLLESVYELFPVLKSYRDRKSAFLSGGEQQMVAIGRMLMSDPKIMLLDEPSVALSPVAVELVVKALLELRKRGASMLLVEQRTDIALRICDRIYILTGGRVADEMAPAAMRGNGAAVISKYLG